MLGSKGLIFKRDQTLINIFKALLLSCLYGLQQDLTRSVFKDLERTAQ